MLSKDLKYSNVPLMALSDRQKKNHHFDKPLQRLSLAFLAKKVTSFGCLKIILYFNLSEDKSAKAQDNRQLTLTLVLVCTSFLLLATPLYFLLAYYSFVDNKASPKTFATFQLIKTIFEQVFSTSFNSDPNLNPNTLNNSVLEEHK